MHSQQPIKGLTRVWSEVSRWKSGKKSVKTGKIGEHKKDTGVTAATHTNLLVRLLRCASSPIGGFFLSDLSLKT